MNNGLDYRVLSFKSRTNKSGLLAWLQNEKDENLLRIGNLNQQFDEKALFEDYLKASKSTIDSLLEKQSLTREKRLLQQHKLTWQSEWNRLLLSEESIANQLFHKWQGEEQELADLNDVDQNLRAESNIFLENTVQSMHLLRDDLKFGIKAYKENKYVGQGDPKDALEIINSGDEQHDEVMLQLDQEMEKLELDTASLLTKKELEIEQLQGIPPSDYFKSCPKDLYMSLSEEFLILDIKYQQQLQNVNERHASIICNPLDGWTWEEHTLFLHAKSVYAKVGENSQELFYDFLARSLPHYSLEDFLNHGKWIKQNKQYRSALQAVIADWKRTKEELRIKAEKFIASVQSEIEKQAQDSIAFRKQKAVCEALYKKVEEWRQQKLHAIQEKEEIERKQYLKEKQNKEREEAKWRKNVKEKLVLYRQLMDSCKEQQLQTLKEKEEQEQLKKKIQAKHNAERVKFRDEQRKIKQEQMKENFILLDQKNKEREIRLEKLRSKVAIEAPQDAFRIFQTTMAADAKRKRKFPVEEEVPILKPLFEVYSFTDDQIASDRRVKLEQKFREAGVLHLPYAQEVLQKIPPPSTPRPDMKSTFKFSEE